jgi:hypothetical protein
MRFSNRNVLLVLAGLVVVEALTVASAPAAVFDQANTNILNSYNVSISSNYTSTHAPIDPNVLRANGGDNDPWQVTWDGVTTPKPHLDFNFGSVRNVSTIKYRAYSSDVLAIGGADIQVSPDGVTWGSVLSSNWTHVSSARDDIALATPVNTQYLRLTASSLDASNNRTTATFMGLKMLGAAGTLTANDIDLVSSTGLQGGVTMALFGTGTSCIDASTFLDDSILKRNFIYGAPAGGGFTLTFPTARNFSKFGYREEGTSGHYKVEIGDGTTWTEAANWTGGSELQFIDLTPTTGTQLRFTEISTGANKITEVMAFESVPEPGTLALLGACGGLELLLRRSRR